MSNTPRSIVYSAIDSERDYQDALGPQRTDGLSKSVGDYLTLIREYSRHADYDYANGAGNVEAMRTVRKIAAIAVQAMEVHGAYHR